MNALGPSAVRLGSETLATGKVLRPNHPDDPVAASIGPSANAHPELRDNDQDDGSPGVLVLSCSANHTMLHGPFPFSLFIENRGTCPSDREWRLRIRRAKRHRAVQMVFRPRSECEGQDKGEAPYLNYDLNIRRDLRLLGSLQTRRTRRTLTMDLRRGGVDTDRSHDE
jgi:hypothetical protein